VVKSKLNASISVDENVGDLTFQIHSHCLRESVKLSWI